MGKRILIADDDATALRLLESHLTTSGYEVLTAKDGAEALRVALAEAPAIVITDWMMPEMDGVQLCRALRAHEGIGFIYTIILTAHAATKGRVVDALDAGADDFLTKPFNREELLARLRAGERIVTLEADLAHRNREVFEFNAKLAMVNQKLERAATTDALTGLVNRRAAMIRIAESWSLSDREHEPLSCMALDIDRFKRFNDTYGHATGDLVLKAVADTLRAKSRLGELVCRFGGEEFLVICTRSTARAAGKGAERLRKAVESRLVTNADGHGLSATVSAGVAERTDSMTGPEDLLKVADEALYAAKRGGRNRVVVAGAGVIIPPNEGSTEPQEADQPPARMAKGLDQREVKILVTDDDADSRAMYRRILRRTRQELVRANEQHGEQARTMTLLLDLAQSLSTAKTLDTVLERIISVTAELTCSRRISIMLPEEQGKHLTIAKAIGMEEEVAAAVRVPVGGATSGRVFARAEPVIINTPEEAKLWRHDYDSQFFASVPLLSQTIGSSENVVGVLNVTERYGGRPFGPRDLQYIDLICNIAASAIEEISSRQARDQARDSIVVALAKLAENRDGTTGRHLDRVTRFSVLLGRELGTTAAYRDQIDDSFLSALQRAVPLHDIGKVGIPDRILLKPGRLNPEEMAIMQTHTEMGAETIRSVAQRVPGVRFLSMGAEIAAGHHEWYDGSGYPRGLQGREIPLSARIAALADVYDALTTKRPYKETLPHDHVVGLIQQDSGTHFDPAVVDAFLRCERQFAALAAELADDDESSGPPLAGSTYAKQATQTVPAGAMPHELVRLSE